MPRRSFRRLVAPATAALAVALPLAVAPTVSASASPRPAPYRIVWDDFRSGFDYTSPNAKWSLIPTGSLPYGDGTPTTSSQGLTVKSSGTNPVTGKPAFVYTTGQENDGGQGQDDHPKWYAAANHSSTAGYLGFDAVPGQVLTCESTISARTFGTERHPFGSAVRDPHSDLRLAAGAMNLIDLETNIVFDFFITNRRLYAFYERLPRPGSTYASFSYALPVAVRTPNQWHKLSVSYDRSAGTVVWKVDGREVLRVDRIGHLPADRKNLILDLGGTEEEVAPRQLSCGFGMFTLLDAEAPGAPEGGLVRLSSQPNLYFDPDHGAPTPQQFVDDLSLPGNRLWGQGVELKVDYMRVSSVPSRPGWR